MDVLAVILLAGALVLMHWAFLEEMDALAFDFALRLRGTEAPDSRIVIVGIDEASLDRVGSWPWPPETIGRLLSRIGGAHPSAIGVDLILGHPLSDYPGLNGLERVVFASALEAAGGSGFGDLSWKEPLLSERGGSALGHIHAGKDADGVCRSLPLVIRAAGKERWAFAVELARTLLGVAAQDVRVEGSALLIGGGIRVPRLDLPIDRAVDAAGILTGFRGDHMLINPRGDTFTFPHLAAADVLDGKPEVLSALADRVVLIGATAYSLGDHLSTPFTGPSEMPGIEIHANALDTVVNQRFLGALVDPWLSLFLVALTVGVWTILAFWPRARTLPVFAVVVAASALGPLLVFLAGDFWIPLVSTTAVVLVSGTTSQFLNYSRLNLQLNRRYRELSDLLAASRHGAQGDERDAGYPGRSLEWKLDVIGEATEAALRLSQERNEMTSFVSHELKTPLTSIQGFAELLEDPGLLSEEDRAEAVRSIRGETIRLAKMVTDFLQLSRLEHQAIQVKREEVRLDQVAGRAAVLLESQLRNRRIRIEGLETIPEAVITGDRDLLTQVLLNLLGNAVKFAPEGSVVRLGGEVESGRCRLVVSDQGPGIPDEDLPRLFQKFFRGRADSEEVAGSGLGLAFVKEVVHQHGGTVEVSSRIGTGSVFTVTLPLRSAGSVQ